MGALGFMLIVGIIYYWAAGDRPETRFSEERQTADKQASIDWLDSLSTLEATIYIPVILLAFIFSVRGFLKSDGLVSPLVIVAAFGGIISAFASKISSSFPDLLYWILATLQEGGPIISFIVIALLVSLLPRFFFIRRFLNIKKTAEFDWKKLIFVLVASLATTQIYLYFDLNETTVLSLGYLLVLYFVAWFWLYVSPTILREVWHSEVNYVNGKKDGLDHVFYRL